MSFGQVGLEVRQSRFIEVRKEWNACLGFVLPC